MVVFSIRTSDSVTGDGELHAEYCSVEWIVPRLSERRRRRRHFVARSSIQRGDRVPLSTGQSSHPTGRCQQACRIHGQQQQQRSSAAANETKDASATVYTQPPLTSIDGRWSRRHADSDPQKFKTRRTVRYAVKRPTGSQRNLLYTV